jgi:hypothetical protein
MQPHTGLLLGEKFKIRTDTHRYVYYDHEQPEVFVGHIVKSRVRIWIQIDTGEHKISKM